MGKRLYVGNLPYSKCTEQGLRDLFAPHTPVDVKVVSDRDTGRPRGFCFVEFADEATALNVIAQFNETYVDERRIVVNVANEKPRSNGGGRRHDSGGHRENSDRARGRRGQEPLRGHDDDY